MPRENCKGLIMHLTLKLPSIYNFVTRVLWGLLEWITPPTRATLWMVFPDGTTSNALSQTETSLSFGTVPRPCLGSLPYKRPTEKNCWMRSQKIQCKIFYHWINYFHSYTQFVSSDQATVDGAGGWKLLKIEEHNFNKLKANLGTLTVKELESILKLNKQEVPKQAKKQEVICCYHNRRLLKLIFLDAWFSVHAGPIWSGWKVPPMQQLQSRQWVSSFEFNSCNNI